MAKRAAMSAFVCHSPNTSQRLLLPSVSLRGSQKTHRDNKRLYFFSVKMKRILRLFFY